MVMLTDFIEKVIKCWQPQTSTPFPTAKLSLFRRNISRHLGMTSSLRGNRMSWNPTRSSVSCSVLNLCSNFAQL